MNTRSPYSHPKLKTCPRCHRGTFGSFCSECFPSIFAWKKARSPTAHIRYNLKPEVVQRRKAQRKILNSTEAYRIKRRAYAIAHPRIKTEEEIRRHSKTYRERHRFEIQMRRKCFWWWENRKSVKPKICQRCGQVTWKRFCSCFPSYFAWIAARRYARNPANIKARNRKFELTHPDWAKEKRKRFVDSHRDYFRKKAREYYSQKGHSAAHKRYMQEYQPRYRFRKTQKRRVIQFVSAMQSLKQITT